jgi:hypothetical protein
MKWCLYESSNACSDVMSACIALVIAVTNGCVYMKHCHSKLQALWISVTASTGGTLSANSADSHTSQLQRELCSGQVFSSCACCLAFCTAWWKMCTWRRAPRSQHVYSALPQPHLSNSGHFMFSMSLLPLHAICWILDQADPSCTLGG